MIALWGMGLAGIGYTLTQGDTKHNEGSLPKVWVEGGTPDKGCGPRGVLWNREGPLGRNRGLGSWDVVTARPRSGPGDECPGLTPTFC